MKVGYPDNNHFQHRKLLCCSSIMATQTQLMRFKISICQTCGSENNQVLLHKCITCHISAVHRYCFPQIPGEIDVDYPFVCAQCETSREQAYEFRVKNSPETCLNMDVHDGLTPRLGDVVLEDGRCNEEDYGKSKDEVLLNTVVMSCAQPIFEPCWRGTFEICGVRFDCIRAHLSSAACLKVVETVKLLPVMISAEMVPRVEMWPNGFREAKPSVENIGIFVFPSSGSDGVKEFDQMIGRMMELDCGLKVLLDNAELLLFSSTQLPERYWRFSGKVYLWGVFTGRKDKSSPSSCVTDSVRASPVSPLSKHGSCSSDMPIETEDTEKLKSSNTLSTWSDNHSVDMSISVSEKTNDISSDDIESRLEVKQMASAPVFNKGVCYKCWKRRKIECTIAEIIEKANSEDYCFKCCGAGHKASACTTISMIECFNCGELTSTNENTTGFQLDFVKPQEEVKEIVCMAVNNQPLKETDKDSKSTESITKACAKLQGQGSKNVSEEANIAVNGSRSRPSENEVEEKCCDFCGAPDHLQPQCEWYIFSVREMKNGSSDDARLFCRDFEAPSNVCNTGTLPVSYVYHNFTQEKLLHPASNFCNNAGGIPEPYLPFNNFGCGIGAGGVQARPYCREELGLLGAGRSNPAPNVWGNSQGAGCGPYLHPNNVAVMAGWGEGRPNFPGNNLYNNFRGVGAETYHPMHTHGVCSNVGAAGGPYYPPNNVYNNSGVLNNVYSNAPFHMVSSNNAWW